MAALISDLVIVPDRASCAVFSNCGNCAPVQNGMKGSSTNGGGTWYKSWQYSQNAAFISHCVFTVSPALVVISWIGGCGG